jgi:phage recombination protein Bet
MRRKHKRVRAAKAMQADSSTTKKVTTNFSENFDNSFQSLVDRSVERSGLSYEDFVRQLINTAFSSLSIWSEADLSRLLLAAERLGLDPLNQEIYALHSGLDQTNGVVLVISVNGWVKLINTNSNFDGMQFTESTQTTEGIADWIECTIFRKDRKHPTTVREYLCEVRGEQGAWLTHPRRMLRHKAMVQCARVCFGLVGVYDPDEATRIISAKTQQKHNPALASSPKRASSYGPSSNERLKSALRAMQHQ